MLLFKICLIPCICVVTSYGIPTQGSNEEYFNMNPTDGKNEFGYDNGVNGSFHFQNQPLEGMSSGCYGQNGDGSQKPHVTYYIVDAAGFRVIHPTNSVNVVIGNSTVQEWTWKQLAMPEGCTKHLQTPSVQSDVSDGTNTPGTGSVNVPVGVVNGLVTIVHSLVAAQTAGANSPSGPGVQNDLGLAGILTLPIALLDGLLGIINGVVGGLVSSVGAPSG